MTDLPAGLEPGRHRDLKGRIAEPWARRLVLVVVLAGVVAALAGAAGQRESSTSTAGPAARMEVRSPDTVRGGLLFQARITVDALRDIKYPRLVLDEGWLDGLQINTIEPNPQSESSRNGKLVLSYPELKAGDRLVVYVMYQLDPTSVGLTTNGVELDDAAVPLATISRKLRRLP